MNDSEVNTCQQSKKRKFLLLIALINTAGIIYYLYFLKKYGYLPPPFFYLPSDSFMDLFNPMYWTFEDGRYTEWKSVYPPLNFIILKSLNYIFGGTVASHSSIMRQDSSLLILGFCLIHLFIPVLILRTNCWIKFSTSEKILVYIAIIFSSPMLFVVERGNLIVFCPLLLAFALSNKGLTRCILFAFLVNIKPYFVLLTFIYVIRRRWKWLVISGVISGLIFIGSGLIVDKNFLEFFNNVLGFSEGDVFALKEIMVSPSSISAFSYVLNNVDMAASFLGFDKMPVMATIIEALKWGAILFSFAILFIKASMVRDTEIILLLLVVITNMGISVGGYSIIFYIPLIPIFITMRFNMLYIALISIMAIPLDFISLISADIGVWDSFIMDTNVQLIWTLGIRSLLLPIANYILLVAVSIELLNRKRNNKNVICSTEPQYIRNSCTVC